MCDGVLAAVVAAQGRFDGRREFLALLRDDVAVVFFAGAAQGFEEDDEEDYADAGAGEHGGGFDAP